MRISHNVTSTYHGTPTNISTIKYWTFWYMEYYALIKSNTLENAWNGRNMWTVNNGHGRVEIFKYGDIPNISFTPGKELNILIYRSPSYLIICRSHRLLNMVRFFGPPCSCKYDEIVFVRQLSYFLNLWIRLYCVVWWELHVHDTTSDWCVHVASVNVVTVNHRRLKTAERGLWRNLLMTRLNDVNRYDDILLLLLLLCWISGVSERCRRVTVAQYWLVVVILLPLTTHCIHHLHNQHQQQLTVCLLVRCSR